MRSNRRGASIIIGLAALAAAGCSQKKTLVPFVIPQTPTTVVTGKTVVFYETFAPEGDAVVTAFEVSSDDGRTFVPATHADGTPPQAVVIAHPSGAPNYFYWDSFADLGPGVFPKVLIRATGYAKGVTGRKAVTAPFAANESGSFTPTRGEQGAARSNALATPLPDGAVLLAGGTLGAQTSALVEVYDPVTEQVQATSALSRPRTNVAGALLTSKRVLLAGGTDTGLGAVTNAELYDRATNAITAISGGLAVARADAGVGALPNGFAVVAGGVDANGVPLSSVELYDPNAGVQGSFSVITSAAVSAVRLPTATALPNGRVLFAGGSDANGNAVTTSFVFDPTLRAVLAGGTMATARVGHRATRLVSGKVLIAGGRARLADPSSATPTVEVYDPDTNSFTTVASMSHARSFHGLDLAGGRVVAVAGSGPAGDTPSTGEVYDVDENSWRPLFFTPVAARTDATLVTSGPGRALLAGGGAPPELYHPLDATKTLDPQVTLNPQPNIPPAGVNPTTLPPSIVPIFAPTVSEAWITLRTPSRPRAFHTATAIQQSSVLLVGGTSGVESATTSVELFEAAPLFTSSDTVTQRAPLNVARAHHAASSVFNGTVLVCGGKGADGTVLGSLERYNPFVDQWTQVGATLSKPRYDHHAVQLSTGDILIVGGRDQTGAPVGLAELYHPSTDTVEPVGSENTPRADDDVLVTPFGHIAVVGGRDSTGALVKLIETYDIFSRSFVAGGLLLEGRAGPALAPSADNRALIATGGESGAPGSTALADYEGIDFSTSVPVPVTGGPQPLDSPRAFHKASVYFDRVVLLSGGETKGLPLDTSSFYVPVTDFFTIPDAFQAVVRPPLNPRMNMPRTGFTATPLHDGRVLAVGGVDHRGVVIPGLETFVR